MSRDDVRIRIFVFSKGVGVVRDKELKVTDVGGVSVCVKLWFSIPRPSYFRGL